MDSDSRLRAKPGESLPCGHPVSAVVRGGEGTAYCGECENEARSLPDDGKQLLGQAIRERLTKGYHAAGHHPNCATRTDDGCDCYARESAAARLELRRLVDLADAAGQLHLEAALEAQRRDDPGATLPPEFERLRVALAALEGDNRV